MTPQVLRAGLICVALATLAPAAAQAQLFGRLFDTCGVCRQSANACCCPGGCAPACPPVCAAAAPVCPPPVCAQAACTTLQPVVETQYRQQQIVTYKDVAETAYRQEAVQQVVPKTTYENVTVDEGSYQTVWVPKQVTRQVARTTYETQTSYRSVPYTTTRRIPQVSTQLVPQQSVRYVAQQAQTALIDPCPPGTFPATVGALPTHIAPPITAAAPTPIITAPQTISAGPIPDPKFLDIPSAENAPWTTVPQRGAEQTVPYDDQAAATIPKLGAAPGRKLFTPAPSAAMVWQTRGIQRN